MLSRIETSFRSIEQFTADASHELRAPLALITTAAEVSLRRERSREELAEVLSKVVREARHMSRLIDNLLDIARGDARKHRSESAPIEIATLLRELCAELTPAAAAKGLTLAADIPYRRSERRWRRHRIAPAFSNSFGQRHQIHRSRLHSACTDLDEF